MNWSVFLEMWVYEWNITNTPYSIDYANLCFLVLMMIVFQMTFGEQNTEKEAHEILSYAFENGINALDTAEAVSFLVQLKHP